MKTERGFAYILLVIPILTLAVGGFVVFHTAKKFRSVGSQKPVSPQAHEEYLPSSPSPSVQDEPVKDRAMIDFSDKSSLPVLHPPPSLKQNSEKPSTKQSNPEQPKLARSYPSIIKGNWEPDGYSFIKEGPWLVARVR